MSTARGLETSALTSWGRTLRAPQLAFAPSWRDELPATLRAAVAARPSHGVLPMGLRRSYGDSGLNPEGAVLLTAALDRIIAFDPATRLLRAEAGLSLAALLAWFVPRGFFLPVTPGTRHVTLGGAVANDVHGKNHHGAGTFGRWVRALGLLRSDGTALELRAGDPLFAATLGGLGLTGLITWVELELLPIASSVMEVEDEVFEDLEGFFRLVEASAGWNYTVAWVDCLAKGASLGRGIFSRGRHAAAGGLSALEPPKLLRMPMDAPGFALNRLTLGAFNALYLAMGRRRSGRPRQVPYLPFFYPLDGIAAWNRLYGKRGFFQYQSVVPPAAQREATRAMLGAIAEAGEGSFLAVLKTFGPLPSPGLLSFPMEGTTLALDFAHRGAPTLALLARLDAIVREAGGRLYPAKDGRMPAAMFQAGYPAWEGFQEHMDPHFSSAFWRRVSQP
jgi:FAD/FMN-containing dehydrogenase